MLTPSRFFTKPYSSYLLLIGVTLAGADEEVAIRSDSTEGQVHHRPCVTGAGERSLSHRHGPSTGQETDRTEGGDGRTLADSYLATLLG